MSNLAFFNSLYDALVANEHANRGPVREDRTNVVSDLAILGIDVHSRRNGRPRCLKRVAVEVIAREPREYCLHLSELFCAILPKKHGTLSTTDE